MKKLRIGHERFTIVKSTKLKALCPQGHPMLKIKTKKAGTFEFCKMCNSTRRISDPQ